MLYCLPKLFASWFQRIFPVFFLNRSLWEQMTPRTLPIWTSGAWLARFMQGITKNWYIHNILDVGLMVLEGFFSFYSQWTIMTSRVWTKDFDPKGMVGRIYVGDHWTLHYIKYISCGPELKWHELRWLAHLLNFWCLRELYVAHGPWQQEFQSSQPKNLMHPFPYHMCFTWNLITTWDIYFFENVNRQRQQTINILINIPHFSLWLGWVKTMWPKTRS